MKDKHYARVVEELPSLKGKVIAITGSTTGTGFWTVVAAIRKHVSKVYLLNRESDRVKTATTLFNEEIEKAGGSMELVNIPCDLMDLENVKKAANTILDSAEVLDVLINNAGIMGFPDRRTKDGFDEQMQVNHLSHFLLTSELLPLLQKTSEQGRDVRVVQHSSTFRDILWGNLEAKYFEKCEPNTLGKNSAVGNFKRYHQTKLANSVFAMALHNKFVEKGLKIKSVVAEPGSSTTDLFSSLAAVHRSAGTLSLSTQISLKGFNFLNFTGILKTQTARDGATPLIYCSFGPDIESGDFYMPENWLAGKPVITISKGEAVIKSKEKMTLSSKNQELLWNISEKSLGISFFN